MQVDTSYITKEIELQLRKDELPLGNSPRKYEDLSINEEELLKDAIAEYIEGKRMYHALCDDLKKQKEDLIELCQNIREEYNLN